MSFERVQLQDIVASQLPSYVVDDFPLLPEFLEQYYISQEFESGPADLLENIDQYVKVDNLYNLRNSTVLGSDLSFTSTSVGIASTVGTQGFSDRDGLIKIDNEIIYYEYKTDTTFENCSRGFSGITTYINTLIPDQLEFEQTEIDEHSEGSIVYNLNIVFLQEFFKRLKVQVIPGFEERDLYTGLDQRNFIYGADSFYSSKGSDESYKILFRALYGQEVEVIKPSEYLIRPSNADYKVTQDYVVEQIQGNPLDLKNRTLYQPSTNARGSISNVEQIPYGGYNYYQISIDYGYARDINVKGTIFGTFETDPKTKILNNVAIGQSFIDVDSTIGFPLSGELRTVDTDGNNVSIGYSGKTDNQFFNVTGVTGQLDLTTDIALDRFCVAYTDRERTEEIKVRMTATLTDVLLPEHTNYYRPKDTISLKSLGIETTTKKSNDWRLNIKSKFYIDEIIAQDLSSRVYKITTSKNHFFREGYKISIINTTRSLSVEGIVNSVTSADTLTVKLDSQVSLNQTLYIENGTLTGNSTRYPQINDYIANVSNTYGKFNGDVLVSGNSIPNYNNVQTNPYDKKIIFSNTVASGVSTDVIVLPTNPTNQPDHGFWTGDAVQYVPGSSGYTGLATGSYFIDRIDEERVKLSRSKSDLFKGIYVSLEGTATDCRLVYLEFYKKEFETQGLYREILPPVNKSGEYETLYGYTGIFNNGVELLNYKSQDSVYYGDIKSLNITNGGRDYDIINPPILQITDETGVGATGVTNTIGSLYKLPLTNPGFGYKEPPEVKITGGNGYGAKAEAKLKRIDYQLSFNAGSTDDVRLGTDRIKFDTTHKLIDGDGLIYQPRNPDVVVGLNTDQKYFINVKTRDAVTLHNTKTDAQTGINTVNLTGLGQGIQYFVGAQKFNVVSSVIVTDPGEGYENKERTLRSKLDDGTLGIQTSLNRINIPNHGYKNKEIVRYSRDPNNPIIPKGIFNNKEYFVQKATQNSFKLAKIGENPEDTYFNYDNGVEVQLRTQGNGSFNYPPIKVDIKGLPNYFDKTFVSDFETIFIIESPIVEDIVTPLNVLAWTGPDGPEALITDGFSVTVDGTSNWLISRTPFIGNQENYDAEVEPLFRGTIQSVDLFSGGVGYGASSIINFNRQPDISFESGSGAVVTPIINGGRISSFIINSKGSGYNTPPHLEIISETGNFAVLTPVVSNGELVDIIIIDPGRNYSANKTFVNVYRAGEGGRATANIQSWAINTFQRVRNNILADDGVVEENLPNSSLQYAHLYAGRALRESTFALNGYDSKVPDNIKYGTYDLIKSGGIEVESTSHSPILGWAYDGNPIYGPYGYANPDGTGGVIKMTSGYESTSIGTNRPSTNDFPEGFFVDDYRYVGDSTLDDHNGRFCVTPDYPNGVYAYFATIGDSASSAGPFEGYFEPVFPYVIGNTFKSVPNDFNFKSSSQQNSYDLASNGWLRNSTYYFINGGDNEYDYIFNSNNVIQQSYEVGGTTRGTVDKLIVENGGHNYKVNDQVLFDNDETGGKGLNVKVSELEGHRINTVSVSSTDFSEVEFKPSFDRESLVGYTSYPHGLETGDIINITGFTTSFPGVDGSYPILVNQNPLTLTLGIQSTTNTGIVTYFYVSGNLQPSFCQPNDIFIIGSEKVKVLNVDPFTRRIRVLRNQFNTIGAAQSSGATLFDDPRDFTIVGSLSTTKTLITNRELYFDPAESVAIGTDTGVGAGTTIVFASPGVARTSIYLNPSEIYIPGHGLNLNDKITYSTNSGTSIQFWSGVEGQPDDVDLTDIDQLYAVPFTQDVLGISSNRVGFGTTTGKYTGVSPTSDAGVLYFTSVGVGATHSFTSDLNGVLTGDVSKNVVTVSLGVTHAMKLGDEVSVDVNPTDIVSVAVTYNVYNRRIAFEPQNYISADINTDADTITIVDNKYKLGDKVIVAIGDTTRGLTNDGMYYIVPLNTNTFQLVDEKYKIYQDNPEVVNIKSTGSGTLFKINPEFIVQKNQFLRFDLSDPSLSFTNGADTFSAFDFFFYRDQEYTLEYNSSKTTDEFEVTYNGRIGVDTNAYAQLEVSDSLPKNLFYNVVPIQPVLSPSYIKEYVDDIQVLKFNQINIENNELDGVHIVSGIGTTTFEYSVASVPDQTNYDSSNSNFSYTTKSETEKGPISRVRIFGKGGGYKTLPGFVSVTSAEGTGGLINPLSDSIGTILNTRTSSIGWDYPTDLTMRGVANLPEILSVTPLLSFEKIGISSGGVNYIFAPDLIVKDGFTGEVIPDLDIRYRLGATEVDIIENTNSLYNVEPDIYPTNNTNGFSLTTATFNVDSKVVRLTLDKQFSDPEEWPFVEGEFMMVENISIGAGVGTTGRGYNSEDYRYDLFEITEANPQLGGAGAYVEYSLANYLSGGEIAGTLESVAVAIVTPQVYFPIFDPTLKIRNYDAGETVVSGPRTGTVERWDSIGQLLYVSSVDDFVVGTSLTSLTSNIKSVIEGKIDYNAEIMTGAGATVYDSWQSDSGVLNNNLQVIPNNEYYQNFSYSLKSQVDYETWDDAVASLAHPAGFEKFADYVVETSAKSTLRPVDVEIDAVVDLQTEIGFNCYADFDLVTERTINVNGTPISNEIVFENRVLQDYFESRGNRVLNVDDFSNMFNSNPRTARFTSVGFFDINLNFNKVLTFARDTSLLDQTQFSVVSVLQDKEQGYVNQYARIESVEPLGWYDVGIGTTGSGVWDLRFYPYEYQYQNYNVSQFSFSVSGILTQTGSLSLGDVSTVSGIHTEVPIGIGAATNVVTLDRTEVRSGKLIAQFESTDGRFYANELNFTHNDTTVEALQYGDLTNNAQLSGLNGFGTYHSYISGSNVIIDFIPSVGVALTVNASLITIATGSNTGVGSTAVRTGDVVSYYESISSSATPGITTICQFTNPESAGYFIISIEDDTNSEYELVELGVIDTQFNQEASVEFGKIFTGNTGLGTIGINTDGTNTNVIFTPIANANVEVRAFGVTLKSYDNNLDTKIIDLENTQLISTTGDYTGTEYDKATEFPLNSEGLPIFSREFDGSDPSVVILANDQVDLPNHYFVTGERVTYSYEGSDIDTTNAISIASTVIAGVTTDKLPRELFIVKRSESRVAFAASAQDALQRVPHVFDLTGLSPIPTGKIVSTKQDTKALLAIDNFIQAPITEVNVSTELDEAIVFDTDFEVVGIQSFVATDLIKVDQEIMQIQSIGVGVTNRFSVLRGRLGSVAEPHGIGATVEKMGGNYTIRESTLYLAGAPKGLVPIGTTTDGPEEVSWAGVSTSSTFQGRTFMRSGVPDASKSTYEDNYKFDNIQSQFDGVESTFRLTQDGQNISGFSTNQAIILNSNILQEPQGEQNSTGDVELSENNIGITSIIYTGNTGSVGYDPQRANVPLGGILISVGSTEGHGFQPLVAAGATCTISGLGTVQSVSIGNSGSGYRPGIQTHIGVYVQVENLGIATLFSIGTAVVQDGHVVSIGITNGGTGYTPLNPPKVVFDEPLPYSNLPVSYASGSVPGNGQGATVDVTVGQGSSVIDFELNNLGFSYGVGETLTVEVGGTTGIPTDTTKSFRPFELFVTDIFRDSFNGWTIGELDVFDKLDEQFDGIETNFFLTIDGNATAIVTPEGSPIDLNYNLIVLIDNVLQIPVESYTFSGGSVITFSEAPRKGSTSQIIFYKGTPDVDVVFVDIIETVKVGDDLQIINDASLGQNLSYKQNERVVTGITTLDVVTTNPYPGPGVVTVTTFERPVTWCKQTDDLIIDGDYVTKDRVGLEPIIYPASLLVSNLSASGNLANVDSVRPLFNQDNETGIPDFQLDITITNQDEIVGALATCIVNSGGAVSAIDVTQNGKGYLNLTNPTASISSPGLSTDNTATVSVTVSGDEVASISVVSGGAGYSQDNPPEILIETPSVIEEAIGVTSYKGDDGQIVGIAFKPSSVIRAQLFIPIDSPFRDPLYVGTALTVSEIDVGDVIVINESNISPTSSNEINGIYTVTSAQTVWNETDVVGYATALREIEFTIPETSSGSDVLVDNRIYGVYSYGNIYLKSRPPTLAKSFVAKPYAGIQTSPLVQRGNPLKFVGYATVV